jgi:hypothetical protein
MASIGSTSGWYDPRYWDQQTAYEHEQRRRYEEAERQRYAAMQQAYYNPNTDTYMGGVTGQQIQEGKQPKPLPSKVMPTPEYIDNKTLLLLE